MKKIALLLYLTALNAAAEISLSRELQQAESAISEMNGRGYIDLLSVVEKWPQLGVLDAYEDKDKIEKVRKFTKDVLADLANTMREMTYTKNANETLEKIDQLVKLNNSIEKKGGYTNSVLSSAISITIRSGFLNILNSNSFSNFSEVERMIVLMNKKRIENFDFKKWIINAAEYDPWVKDHQNYIGNLPSFPTILDITFQLMKANEKIPNRISHAHLLDKVNAFQLGIYHYESDFFEVCVIPFWLQYISHEGIPKADFLDKSESKYHMHLQSIPVHPFFGSNLSMKVLHQFWIDSTGTEGIRQLAAAIIDQS